jgi:LPS-assembly lipoprotein
MNDRNENPFASSVVKRQIDPRYVARLSSSRTALILLCSSIALSACGLEPLYSGGSQGAVTNLLGSVTVEPIEGKNGWLVRNAVNDRLNAANNVASTQTRYSLKIKLDDQIEGFGVRTDDTVTRERRTLRARYQLIDLTTGKILLDTTAGSDAGIDVVSSEYATIAGENNALENLAQRVAEQIVTRLSLYARAAPVTP